MGDICDLYSELSAKFYKMGQIFTKIHQNSLTIEKYCENNLKNSHKLSESYHHIRNACYLNCNQLKKPCALYANLFKPLAVKSSSDFQSVYDVSQPQIDAQAAQRAQQKLQFRKQAGQPTH